MFYPRRIQKELFKQLSSKEIIVLTGMRRTGKTTLYKTIFEQIESKNKLFIDLENPVTQKAFEETDYNNIITNLKEFGIDAKQKAYVFIDEIQTMPNVVKAIKYLYDHFEIKFFLTGSSSYYLKNLFPESLAGRKFVFELYPLDFEEFLVFKSVNREQSESFSQKDSQKNFIRHEKIKGLYEEYLKYGGFPQVVLEDDPHNKGLHLQDIFKAYFEKDVKNMSGFRELQIFRELILLLMARTGSKLDVSRIASEIGVSRQTAYSYITFLQSTFFIFLVNPFTKSADKLVSKAKKVYFCDTGLIREFSTHSEGQVFENSVFNNLTKYGNVNYYQRSSGREIDFVLNNRVGIEVKTKGIPDDYNKLKTVSDKIGLKECYVVNREFSEHHGFIPITDL